MRAPPSARRRSLIAVETGGGFITGVCLEVDGGRCV